MNSVTVTVSRVPLRTRQKRPGQVCESTLRRWRSSHSWAASCS